MLRHRAFLALSLGPVEFAGRLSMVAAGDSDQAQAFCRCPVVDSGRRLSRIFRVGQRLDRACNVRYVSFAVQRPVVICLEADSAAFFRRRDRCDSERQFLEQRRCVRSSSSSRKICCGCENQR